MASEKALSAPKVLGASWDPGVLTRLLKLRPRKAEPAAGGQVTWEPSLLPPLIHCGPLGKADAKSSASLYTRAELNLGDGVLGEVEKNSFIGFPDKEGHNGLMPSKPCIPPLGEDSEKFYSNCSKRAWSARGHSSDWLVVR